MSKGKIALIAVLAVFVAFLAIGIAASGGGEENEKKTSGIKLSGNDYILYPTGSVTVKAALTPEDSAQDVTWESSNEAVATVDQDGKIKYRGVGVARITATSGDFSAASFVTCMVAFEDPLPLSKGYAQMWAERYLTQYPLSEKFLGLLLERYGFSEEATEYALATCGPEYGPCDWEGQCVKACEMLKKTGLYDSAGAMKYLKGDGFTEDQVQKAIAKVYGLT